jgi:RNA polymerase sigma-70 factor (ECF subfamily)
VNADDHSLVRAAMAGRAAAREALFTHWLPTVLDWCVWLGGPKVDAEDAAQEVFVIVLRRLDRLRDAEAFPGWIYGVTRRVLAARRRRAWVRRWMPGVEPTGVSLAPGPDEVVGDAQLRAQVGEALAQLPAKLREALVLYELDGRTAREIAGLLGVSEGTVRSRIRLGRARLHEIASDMGLLEAVSQTQGWSAR